MLASAVLVLLALAAAVTYTRAAVRLHRAGRWSHGRTAMLWLGVLVTLAACVGPVDDLAHRRLWVYTVSACVVLVVAPLLIGFSAPTQLLRLSCSPTARARWGRLARSPLVRLLRLPGMGPLLLILATSVLFFTPLLEASLRQQFVLLAVRLGLLAAGLVLALPVTDDAAATTSVGYAAMLGLGLAEFVLDAVPGIALRLQSHLVAPAWWVPVHHTAAAALADQRLAGSWLWFFGEAGDLPFLAALAVAWMRADAREAARIDAELDAADAAAASQQGAGPGVRA